MMLVLQHCMRLFVPVWLTRYHWRNMPLMMRSLHFLVRLKSCYLKRSSFSAGRNRNTLIYAVYLKQSMPLCWDFCKRISYSTVQVYDVRLRELYQKLTTFVTDFKSDQNSGMTLFTCFVSRCIGWLSSLFLSESLLEGDTGYWSNYMIVKYVTGNRN